MKIATMIIIRVVDISSGEELSSTQGAAASAVIPRQGEFIELTLNANSRRPIDNDIKVYKVINVTHKYDDTVRNIITLQVETVDPTA